MSRLDRWKADHSSNRMDDGMAKKVMALHTPFDPVPCRYCGYPGTFAGLCMVCQALGEAIEIMRTRSYWLRTEADIQAKRRGAL